MTKKNTLNYYEWQCSVSHVKTVASMTAYKLSSFLITLQMSLIFIFFDLRKKDANIFYHCVPLVKKGGGGAVNNTRKEMDDN